MRNSPFRSRRKHLEQQARLAQGNRVRYIGGATAGIARGTVGTIASAVPARMDVTPFATPPTVPEEANVPEVEVDFEGAGRRKVALVDLVLNEP